METNVKVVGFANQSINGINVNNQGFDLEYDGDILNLTGFSGDKLYYAKLNNEQIRNVLQTEPSKIPLEQRIMNYHTNDNNQYKLGPMVKKIKIYPHKTYKRAYKHTPTPYHHSYSKSNKSHRISSYKSPRLRSEYKKTKSRKISKIKR